MHLPKDHHSIKDDQHQRETILIKEVEYRNGKGGEGMERAA